VQIAIWPYNTEQRQILARAKPGKVSFHLSSSRRAFLKSLSRSALVLPLESVLALARPLHSTQTVPAQHNSNKAPGSNSNQYPPPPSDIGVSFLNVARESGLNAKTIFGGQHKNKYLLETTGCGVAFYDYDNDDWLDICLVNGWRLEGFPKGQEPVSHLFKNNRDGTFTDVTSKSGFIHYGWGQGVCVGDYDNDGFDDIYITSFGKNVLFHNNGNGTFTDVTEKAGVGTNGKRWNTGCAFVDYDRDGHHDLFVANYIDLDLATAPLPESGPCSYKGVLVACGPPGLLGGKNILFHNNGDGTFADVSERAGIFQANGTFGLGVLTADFNNDGWPDIYVANDSTASALYQNKKNGTFSDVSEKAGLGPAVFERHWTTSAVWFDFDNDGRLDLFVTTFFQQPKSLSHKEGGGRFSEVGDRGGIAGPTMPYVVFGKRFFDLDHDGWEDILFVNGHVYAMFDCGEIYDYHQADGQVYIAEWKDHAAIMQACNWR